MYIYTCTWVHTCICTVNVHLFVVFIYFSFSRPAIDVDSTDATVLPTNNYKFINYDENFDLIFNDTCEMNQVITLQCSPKGTLIVHVSALLHQNLVTKLSAIFFEFF